MKSSIKPMVFVGFAFGLLVAVFAPSILATPSLPVVSANRLLDKAQRVFSHGNFVVTWRLRTASVSTSSLGLNELPLAPEPWILSSAGDNWNFYDANQYQWRFENESSSGTIERVVARLGNQLTIGKGQQLIHQRLAKISWTLPWAIHPKWVASTFHIRVAREPGEAVPMYRVTLVPRINPLHYTYTYWIQAEYAVPLGFRVAEKTHTVFFLTYQAFSEGAPGPSADPPSASENN
ncbi:MAG: hypothetical protein C7B46_04505 [Sulfobacillus benefaciens]|uniref:Uncharacterized protein n=1 Tax=Sulfobacillus benefaciens TaxID=453960 RepID=A0A2T2XJN2_9FIRM|nr:MAG: hypothetical protein C7B46_04505 [Sulfobacillus benefaciens]